MRIDVKSDGPYLVSGGVPLLRVKIVRDEKKEAVAWEQTGDFPLQEVYALCRCGGSANKPFCDGTHAKNGFDGTETAGKAPYDANTARYDGGDVVLHDNEEFCVGAEFCDRFGGIWALARATRENCGIKDPDEAATYVRKAHEAATEMACNCPSGRLVIHHVADGTDVIVEPDFPEPSIALIEDPVYGASGAIWVRGAIPIYDTDEQPYEPRNRVTLCRCGASRNKPFCNGLHYRISFNDNLEQE